MPWVWNADIAVHAAEAPYLMKQSVRCCSAAAEGGFSCPTLSEDHNGSSGSKSSQWLSLKRQRKLLAADGGVNGGSKTHKLIQYIFVFHKNYPMGLS